MNNKTKKIIFIMISIAFIGLYALNRLISSEKHDGYGDHEIEEVKTVYFEAELYKQGKIECWLMLDKEKGNISHFCLHPIAHPLYTINSPAGCFTYNKITNKYSVNIRDERKMKWYPDFQNFFKKYMSLAQKDKNINISNSPNSDESSDIIVVTVQGKDNEIEYRINKKDKLLVNFHTTKIKNSMNLYKEIFSIRDMNHIVYNDTPAEEIFIIPENAEQVFNEHDLFIHPGVGMPVQGLSHQQACEKIVKEAESLLNLKEWKNLSKLIFPFFEPPEEILKTIPDNPDMKLTEVLKTGDADNKNGYWYLPVKSKEFPGKIKNEVIPIKFYEFDDNKYCMIMWPD